MNNYLVLLSCIIIIGVSLVVIALLVKQYQEKQRNEKIDEKISKIANGLNDLDRKKQKLQKDENLNQLNQSLKEKGFSDNERDKRMSYAEKNYSTNVDGSISTALIALLMAESFNENSDDAQSYSDSITDTSHQDQSNSDSNQSHDSSRCFIHNIFWISSC